MSFDENAFIIAGTAIAIFGVGIYIWDTRGKPVVEKIQSYNQSTTGGSRRRKNNNHKKTKRYK